MEKSVALAPAADACCGKLRHADFVGSPELPIDNPFFEDSRKQAFGFAVQCVAALAGNLGLYGFYWPETDDEDGFGRR